MEKSMMAFNVRKTIEAAAYLIKRHPCRSENCMRLVKLLYLADRASLAERGTPICGGEVYAMERGPVISPALDLMNGSDPQSSQWDRFIEKLEYDVHLRRDPGNLSLSRAEMKILDEVAERFRPFDEWALVKWCHDNLPEYEKSWKARGDNKRRRIPLEDLLDAIGRGDDQAAILAAIEESAAFDKFFGNHMPASVKPV